MIDLTHLLTQGNCESEIHYDHLKSSKSTSDFEFLKKSWVFRHLNTTLPPAG